jgi:hypothetical protein
VNPLHQSRTPFAAGSNGKQRRRSQGDRLRRLCVCSARDHDPLCALPAGHRRRHDRLYLWPGQIAEARASSPVLSPSVGSAALCLVRVVDRIDDPEEGNDCDCAAVRYRDSLADNDHFKVR